MGEKVYNYLKRLNLWNNDDMFAMYDIIHDANGNGSLEKGFARCKGKYLKELYDSIHNDPSSSYVTSMNEAIKNMTFEEFSKCAVPVIIKEVRNGNKDYMNAEFICSRLANILGVKTAYYAPIDDGAGYIMSVDFLKVLDNYAEYPKILKCQTVETFNEITEMQTVHTKTPIATWIHLLDFKLWENDDFRCLSEKQVSQIITELIRQILFRKYIIQDNDFHGGNIAFVHSEDYSDLEISPMYDYEFCLGNELFYGRNMSAAQRNELRDADMEYLFENYPKETLSALKGFEMTKDKRSRMEEVMSRYMKNKINSAFWFRIVSNNIMGLLAIRDKYLASMSSLEGEDSYEI